MERNEREKEKEKNRNEILERRRGTLELFTDQYLHHDPLRARRVNKASDEELHCKLTARCRFRFKFTIRRQYKSDHLLMNPLGTK